MSNAIQIIPVSVSDEACTKGEYFNIAYNLLKAQQSELTVIMEKVNSQTLLKKYKKILINYTHSRSTMLELSEI